jgi:hypothetical protein
MRTSVKKDGYSRQMDRLKRAKNFRDKMYSEWREGKGLFQFATSDGCMSETQSGCLTMIRGFADLRLAQSTTITEAIRADERIPTEVHLIWPRDLVVFAEWQRRLDREFNRTPYIDKGWRPCYD